MSISDDISCLFQARNSDCYFLFSGNAACTEGRWTPFLIYVGKRTLVVLSPNSRFTLDYKKQFLHLLPRKRQSVVAKSGRLCRLAWLHSVSTHCFVPHGPVYFGRSCQATKSTILGLCRSTDAEHYRYSWLAGEGTSSCSRAKVRERESCP